MVKKEEIEIDSILQIVENPSVIQRQSILLHIYISLLSTFILLFFTLIVNTLTLLAIEIIFF